MLLNIHAPISAWFYWGHSQGGEEFQKEASPVVRDSLNLSLGPSPKLALRERLCPPQDTSWNGWVFEGWGRLREEERAGNMARSLLVVGLPGDVLR